MKGGAHEQSKNQLGGITISHVSARAASDETVHASPTRPTSPITEFGFCNVGRKLPVVVSLDCLAAPLLAFGGILEPCSNLEGWNVGFLTT